MSDYTISPCIRKCTLDADDICMGCYRSLREILDWTYMNLTEQRVTLQRCDERREQKKSAYSLINKFFR